MFTSDATLSPERVTFDREFSASRPFPT